MKKPHKHKDAIIAWADGAEIEVYLPVSEKWEPISIPTWDDYATYRVKPQPKLVPFSLPEDADKLIGKAIVSKESGFTILITGVSKEVCVNGAWVELEYLLEKYTFPDGSPCGKYVEEQSYG